MQVVIIFSAFSCYLLPFKSFCNFSLIKLRAFDVNLSMLSLREAWNWSLLVSRKSGPDMAIHTVPTGLTGVPPSGPATPDVAIE